MSLRGWLSRRRGGEAGAALPEGPVDLADPAFIADPYPLYTALRRARPAAEIASGGWLITRHADVKAAFTHPDLGAAPSRFSVLHARHRERRVCADLAANILPFLDMPAHRAPRRILSRALRAAHRRLERAPLELAAAQARAARRGGAAELVGPVAAPYALALACRLLDLPEAEGPRLKAWSESFFRLFAPIRDAEALARMEVDLAAFRAHLRDALRAAPAEGLMADLARPDADGTALPEALVVDSLILIFADAVENLPYAAATALMTLSAHDGALARAAQDPGFARAAVQEALRRDPPAQSIPRIARRDTEVAGRAVAAETPVFLSLASANRDPEAFEAPDAFRPERDPGAGLGFGLGRHSCLGAALALDQTAALIAALAQEGAHTPTRPETAAYAPRFGHRWPEAVALTFAARP